MKNRTKLFGVLGMALTVILSVGAFAAPESLYDETLAGAHVNFPPNRHESSLVSIQVQSDDPTAVVEIYGKTSRHDLVSTPTNGSTIIFVANTTAVLNTNDLVCYFHSSGDYVDYTTIASNTASNVWLAAGITSAGGSGDKLYEMVQRGEIGMLSTNQTWFNLNAGSPETPLFVLGDDNPFRILVNGTASVVNATVSDKNFK